MTAEDRTVPSSRRFSFDPVSTYLGGTPKTQAEILGVPDRQVYRWRRYGLTREQAEAVANRLRLHVYELFPELVEVDAAIDVERESRLRARRERYAERKGAA